jgi:hypothetical protein
MEGQITRKCMVNVVKGSVRFWVIPQPKTMQEHKETLIASIPLVMSKFILRLIESNYCL